VQLPAGAYISNAVADLDDEVEEASETNNTATDSFTVVQAEEPPVLTFILLSLPAHGTLATAQGAPITAPGVLASPVVRYTPAVDFSGTDGFSYQVSNGIQLSNVALIDLLVFEFGCTSCADLAIDLTGSGLGDVASNPPASNDLFACADDCTMEFAPGTAVTLQARPLDSLSVFAGWSGDCSGSSSVITLTMGAAGSTRTCEARFESND
jgi:hypothetical protein